MSTEVTAQTIKIEKKYGITHALKKMVSGLSNAKLSGGKITASEWNATLDTLVEINEARKTNNKTSIFTGGTDKTKEGWHNSFVVNPDQEIEFTAEEMTQIYEAMGVTLTEAANNPEDGDANTEKLEIKEDEKGKKYTATIKGGKEIKRTYCYNDGIVRHTVEINENGQKVSGKQYSTDGTMVLEIETYKYADDGTCTKTLYKADGKTPTGVTKYKYNDDGKCTEEISYDADGKTQTSVRKYQYEGDKCTEETFYEADGKNIIDRTKYKYEGGKCIETTYYEGDGKLPTSVLSYIYNEDGKCTERIYAEDKFNSIVEFTYNTDGSIKQRDYSDSDKQKSTRKYEYEEGILKKQTYDSGNNHKVYEYKNGVMTKCFIRNADDEITQTSTYEYDGYRVKKETITNSNSETTIIESSQDEATGVLTATRKNAGRSIEVSTYDSQGNLTQIVEKDSNDKVVQTFYYDANSNCIKKTIYNPDNSEVIKTIEYKYNANGFINKETCKDENGKTKSVTEFKYDANGNYTKKTYKNAAGRVQKTVEYKNNDDGSYEETTKVGNTTTKTKFDADGNEIKE